jgi:drug/metabolite transporter (DMT)-like permease
MTWIIFAISGYFILAAVGIADKILLKQRATTNPIVYSFYIGLLSIFTFILAPFGLHWPGTSQFLLALIAGFIFFLSLVSLYKSLDINEASRTLPAIGGLTPILVLFLSFLFLKESLNGIHIIAFLLLVVGGVLISLKTSRRKSRLVKGSAYLFLAVGLGAIYYVLEKYIFTEQGFISGFVWSRFGLAITSASILLVPRWRRLIFSSEKRVTAGLSLSFVFNKFMAGVGSLLIHLAISMTSVSLVNAMQGTQYVFLFIFAIMLSIRYPQFIKENLDRKTIIQKIIAIVSIITGLSLLYL